MDATNAVPYAGPAEPETSPAARGPLRCALVLVGLAFGFWLLALLGTGTAAHATGTAHRPQPLAAGVPGAGDLLGSAAASTAGTLDATVHVTARTTTSVVAAAPAVRHVTHIVRRVVPTARAAGRPLLRTVRATVRHLGPAAGRTVGSTVGSVTHQVPLPSATTRPAPSRTVAEPTPSRAFPRARGSEQRSSFPPTATAARHNVSTGSSAAMTTVRSARPAGVDARAGAAGLGPQTPKVPSAPQTPATPRPALPAGPAPTGTSTATPPADQPAGRVPASAHRPTGHRAAVVRRNAVLRPAYLAEPTVSPD